MSPRERMLAMGVLIVVFLAGGAFLFHQLFLAPLRDREDSIAGLQQEIDKKQDRIRQVEAEKPKFERWKLLSLPPDVSLARREYEKYFSELLQESGLEPGAFKITVKEADTKSSPTVPGKGPVYTKLTAVVSGPGSLPDLVTLLEHFYHTGLLQQIKTLAITRPLTTAGTQQQLKPTDLDANMTVEALIVNGVEGRAQLVPHVDRKLLAVDVLTSLRGGPGGLGRLFSDLGPTGPGGPGTLAQPTRDYAAIARKNIFFGDSGTPRSAEEVEVTRFVHLTDITQNSRRSEAYLYDRLNNRRTRLRSERGFDSFRILDDKGDTAVRGQVLRIDSRDLVFRVDTEYFLLHVGQSLEEAMKAPLSAQKKKDLGLAMPQETAQIDP